MVYKGTIIEERLENKDVLRDLKITKTVVEPVTPNHKTPWLRQWTLHTVEIKDSDAEKIARKISSYMDKYHNWYADFKSETRHIIVFRNKIFNINRKEEEYKKVKE
ncbi:MAG: hypothetical protein PHH00_04315, partial [Candidatus Nanoarchaeia archaeon]|nr:hypothetical protein [Candidatus Nanoarchaeia archaeon]